MTVATIVLPHDEDLYHQLGVAEEALRTYLWPPDAPGEDDPFDLGLSGDALYDPTGADTVAAIARHIADHRPPQAQPVDGATELQPVAFVAIDTDDLDGTVSTIRILARTADAEDLAEHGTDPEQLDALAALLAYRPDPELVAQLHRLALEGTDTERVVLVDAEAAAYRQLLTETLSRWRPAGGLSGFLYFG